MLKNGEPYSIFQFSLFVHIYVKPRVLYAYTHTYICKTSCIVCIHTYICKPLSMFPFFVQISAAGPVKRAMFAVGMSMKRRLVNKGVVTNQSVWDRVVFKQVILDFT